jgi:hypothetical protein
LAPFCNLLKLLDDESVQSGKHCDWSKSEQDLTDYQVCPEHGGLTDVLILHSLPRTGGIMMILILVKTHHMVLETEGNVEEDAGQEGEGDVDLSILECVQSVEMCGSVDGDVTVDGQADDVHRAGHELAMKELMSGSFKCAW